MRPMSGWGGRRCRTLTSGPTCTPSRKIDWLWKGFDHYEISNWSRPGFESTHNLAYWNLTPYLGLGPGAHSFVLGRRFSNIRSPRGYIRRLEALDAPGETASHPAETMRALGVVEEVEPTDRGTAMADAMMMGMRLAQGVSHARFEQRFGVKLTDAFGDAIREMSDGSADCSRSGRDPPNATRPASGQRGVWSFRRRLAARSRGSADVGQVIPRAVCCHSERL